MNNYYKKKKKYEILKRMKEIEREAFIYHNMTKEMIEAFNNPDENGMLKIPIPKKESNTRKSTK